MTLKSSSFTLTIATLFLVIYHKEISGKQTHQTTNAGKAIMKVIMV